MLAVVADNGECTCSDVEYTSVGRVFAVAAAVTTSLTEGGAEASCVVVLRQSGGHNVVCDGEEGDSLYFGFWSFGDGVI